MQRYAISLMLKEKKTQSAIAEAIGVDKSTISRELKRNSTGGKHHYTSAQELCEIRKERLREPRKFNVSTRLGAKVYFADPYSFWQKGLIENTNMLIRQYIPRDDNFSKLTDEQVAEIQYKINRRPRKNWTSASRIKNFIYLCNRELRFGLESIFFVFEK